MSNVFLKVNKDLFNLELNPTEILILAQVIEFNTNTGECFMTDAQFAKNYNVSVSTVSRAIKSLESKGFIERKTKNVKGGKERHIFVKLNKIEEELTKVNLKVDEDLQTSNCLVSNVNLPIDKEQNELIKDNGKDKEKDNLNEIVPKEEGTIEKPIVVEKEWLVERHNELTKLANGLFKYQNNFYKMK